MAENLRHHDSQNHMIDLRVHELVAECNRQAESCLYTSTELHIWLRDQRFYQRAFIVLPIILGGVATWSVLDQPSLPWLKWVTAACALVAGLLPAIYEALKPDIHLDNIARYAAEYTNLRDRFRQAEKIGALKLVEELEAEFNKTMQQMEEARRSSLTPPERYYKKAKKKIEGGDYTFSADMKKALDSAAPNPPA